MKIISLVHAAMEHIEIDENLLFTKLIAIMIVKW